MSFRDPISPLFSSAALSADKDIFQNRGIHFNLVVSNPVKVQKALRGRGLSDRVLHRMGDNCSGR